MPKEWWVGYLDAMVHSVLTPQLSRKPNNIVGKHPVAITGVIEVFFERGEMLAQFKVTGSRPYSMLIGKRILGTQIVRSVGCVCAS